MPTFAGTLRDHLIQAEQLLSEAECPNPALEAEILMMDMLDYSRAELMMNAPNDLSLEDSAQYADYVNQRTNHIPVQYITGKAWFMNYWLEVGPGVLIPRPETELLVDYVLQRTPENGTVCDIGTGSGTISLTLAYERPDLKVVGVDYHHEALSYAIKNKERLNLSNVTLLESDLLSAVSDKSFDVITANLPYVSQEEYDALTKEVKEFEPKTALYSPDKGLWHIARTIEQAPAVLNDNGLIIFEIGYEQGPAVADLLHNSSDFTDVEIIKDLNALDRFVKAVRS